MHHACLANYFTIFSLPPSLPQSNQAITRLLIKKNQNETFSAKFYSEIHMSLNWEPNTTQRITLANPRLIKRPHSDTGSV